MNNGPHPQHIVLLLGKFVIKAVNSG